MILLYERFYTFKERVKNEEGKDTDERRETMDTIYHMRVYFCERINVIHIEIIDISVSSLYSSKDFFVLGNYEESIERFVYDFLNTHNSFLTKYADIRFGKINVIEEDDYRVVVGYELYQEPICKVFQEVHGGVKLSIYNKGEL